MRQRRVEELMDTIQKIALVAHTLIAVLIIVLVLLQRGKGADAGAGFGAGASGTVFGARGSGNFFSRATAVMATAFFASSLTLAYLSSQQSTAAPPSLLDDAPTVEAAETEDFADDAAVPIPDMPSVEAVDDAGDLPTLDDEDTQAETDGQ
jgi:preprotein translocase subunit SecG